MNHSNNRSSSTVKAFGELSNIDSFGFAALGDYHKARLAFAAGEVDKAKDLLQAAQKALDNADKSADKSDKKLPGNPSYLQTSVRDLLHRVDPTAVTAAPNSLTADQIQELQDSMGANGAGPSGKGLSKAQITELLKHMGQSNGAKPPAPAAPVGAP